MRTIDEIEKDIAAAQKDRAELLRMRANTCVIDDDLDELYEELKATKKGNL